MPSYPRIILRKGKEEPVMRFHPWIFSGAIREVQGRVAEGDMVEVFSADGSYLATGHYLGGSIAVKLFAFIRKEIDNAFWEEKIREALSIRQQTGICHASTNAYRLVHNEGDGMPGLIIDIYNGLAVIQAHSVGMYRLRKVFAGILKNIFGDTLQAVYDKSSESIQKMSGRVVEDEFLLGSSGPPEILENGHRFLVGVEKGQKTGFFLDQRDNRMLVQHYAGGRTVLNMFGYTGGFSVYAAAGGAKLVHTVDVSAPAIEMARQNLSLNGFDPLRHTCSASDAWQFLDKSAYGLYDLIILDPPAYAKSISNRQQAMKGYRNLNALAFRRIAPGGLLFTFSCSQVVDRQMFTSAVTAAAVDSGRRVRVVHHLSQPPDHPVSIFHQEGEYLKGLVLAVE